MKTAGGTSPPMILERQTTKRSAAGARGLALQRPARAASAPWVMLGTTMQPPRREGSNDTTNGGSGPGSHHWPRADGGGTDDWPGERCRVRAPGDRPRGVTFTGLSLSAAQVTFGAEQGEKVTFTVSNLSGPAPPGTVSVFATGNGSSTFSCSGILTPLLGSLTFSAGSCRLGSSPLSPGSYDVGATYPGNTAQGNFASASPGPSPSGPERPSSARRRRYSPASPPSPRRGHSR